MTKKSLLNFYSQSGKHACYQPLPSFVVAALGADVPVDQTWRADHGRLCYLRENFDFAEQRVVDVGANTGLFAATLAYEFTSSRCLAWEADASSAAFIRKIAEEFGLDNLSVRESVLDYSAVGNISEYFDVALLFNVLHHAGVDFDVQAVRGRQELQGYIHGFLRALRPRVGCLFYQMGYNWGGDVRQPVVRRNSLQEKLDYIEVALHDTGWRVEHVGLVTNPESRRIELFDWSGAKKQAGICDRLGLDGLLSEFYLRPLFKLV